MDDTLKRRLRDELRGFERRLTEPSIAEALRLLAFPRFADVTAHHVREVAEYRPIEVAGERFFVRAWSRSKDAAAILGLALLLGAETVLCDLSRLAAAAGVTPS